MVGVLADITMACQAGWAVAPATNRPGVTPSALRSLPSVVPPVVSRASASAASGVASSGEGPTLATGVLVVMGEPPTVSRWPALLTVAVRPLPRTCWPPIRWVK